MQEDPTTILTALEPESAFFIGIDSDGCVFDSMELKHKECFCPAFVNHFGFQGVCGAARETWEFVNLYSRGRGLNRFKAAVEALNLLNQREEVIEQMGTKVDTGPLEEWIAGETRLSGPVLAEFLASTPDGEADSELLQRALRWSKDVGEAVERIVHDLPPMSEAVEALQKMQGKADCVVVSQTPTEDLIREWNEHGIADVVRVIAGQELGTKAEHLAQAAGSKYAAGQVLMVGDAPGDHQAAEANNALFFPIVPGQERASWCELRDHGLDHFFSGSYAGGYQDQLLEAFYNCLPETPPWRHC